MSTQTMTLADFLLARIADDQAVASANTDHFEYPRWDVWSVERRGERAVLIRQASPGARKSGRLDVHHTNIQMLDQLARWDPARVLAECEAKRRIIDWAFANAEQIDSEWGDCCGDADLRAGRCDDYGARAVEEVLTKLALPYASHPDYDEAWRP